MTDLTGPGAFAACFAALYAAHQVADHLIQTQHQADTKGLPGWRGRLACAAHVTTYTAAALVALLVIAWRTGLPLHPWTVVAGLAVSAITHYVADRRAPLRTLLDRLGKSPAWLDHGGGMYACDQAWHIGWLAVAALIIA
jgi:hypothetical protein